VTPTPGPLPLLPDPLGVPLDDGHRLDEGQELDDGHRLDDQLPEPSLPDELHHDEPLHELPEDDHQLLPDELPLDDPDELHHDELPEELGHQDELGQADELHHDELLLDQPLDDPLELQAELDPDELPELLPDELPLDDPLDELDDDEQHPSPRATTSHLRLSSNRLASPNVPAGTDSADGQSHPSPEVDAPLHKSGQTTPIES
jgi:hypothetical protein